MASKETVLVIGGCGGLGFHIVKHALDDGYNVVVLDVRTGKNRRDGAQYIEGSLTSKETVLKVLNDTQAAIIINTASPTMMLEHENKKAFDEVNIGGTENLLRCAREVEFVKAFVYTSSSSIVHDNYTSLVDATEVLPYVFEPQQKEHYSHTKAVAEKMVLEANGTGYGKILTTSIRAATMLGEADSFTVPNLISNAKSGRLKFQVGDGKNMFDFTYTGNTAHAHILACRALIREHAEPPAPELKVNGEAFFITNDEPWPFWDIPRALGAAAGYPVRKEDIWQIPATLYYGVAFLMEWFYTITSFGKKRSPIDRKMVRYLTMTRTFDISKAKTRLGYKPQVDMKEGIKRAADWYLAQEGNPTKSSDSRLQR